MLAGRRVDGKHSLLVLKALVEADLTDREATRNIFSKFEIDTVIHLAALAPVEDSVREPARYYRHNVVGLLTLLDTMLEFGVKKIIFSSSTAVYGVPDEVPIREGSAPLAVNPYGQTKLVGERILEDYFRAYGLGSVSLRYFNVAEASAEHGEIIATRVIWCQECYKLHPAYARTWKSTAPITPRPKGHASGITSTC